LHAPKIEKIRTNKRCFYNGLLSIADEYCWKTDQIIPENFSENDLNYRPNNALRK